MSRFRIGIALLLILPALGILTQGVLQKTGLPLAARVERAADGCQAGRWDLALEDFDRARADWESRRNIAAALADHAPLEDIDALFAQAGRAAAGFEETEFLCAAAELGVRLRALAQSHSLRWWSLL